MAGSQTIPRNDVVIPKSKDLKAGVICMCSISPKSHFHISVSLAIRDLRQAYQAKQFYSCTIYSEKHCFQPCWLLNGNGFLPHIRVEYIIITSRPYLASFSSLNIPCCLSFPCLCIYNFMCLEHPSFSSSKDSYFCRWTINARQH